MWIWTRLVVSKCIFQWHAQPVKWYAVQLLKKRNMHVHPFQPHLFSDGLDQLPNWHDDDDIDSRSNRNIKAMFASSLGMLWESNIQLCDMSHRSLFPSIQLLRCSNVILLTTRQQMMSIEFNNSEAVECCPLQCFVQGVKSQNKKVAWFVFVDLLWFASHTPSQMSTSSPCTRGSYIWYTYMWVDGYYQVLKTLGYINFNPVFADSWLHDFQTLQKDVQYTYKSSLQACDYHDVVVYALSYFEIAWKKDRCPHNVKWFGSMNPKGNKTFYSGEGTSTIPPSLAPYRTHLQHFCTKTTTHTRR